MLRGASAEALGDLERQLRSTQATLADTAVTGEELFSAAAVLRSEPALRRVATDASVPAEAKAGIANEVFGKVFGEEALSLVTEAVQRRWTSSRDLPDALERLAVVATVRSTGKDAGTVSDELFAVVRLLEDNPELRSALSDRSRTSEDRGGLLTGLLDGKVQEATSLLVRQAVAAGGSVEKVLAGYQSVAAAAQDETLAVVRTAHELSTQDLERLAVALSKQYGTTVHLHVVVEPDLVGGLRVEIGDDRIDGTISSRLDDARRRLVG